MYLRMCLVVLVLSVACASNSPLRTIASASASAIRQDQSVGIVPRLLRSGHSTGEKEHHTTYTNSRKKPKGEAYATAKARAKAEVGNGPLTYRAAVVEFKVNSTFLFDPDVTSATTRMMSNLVGFEVAVKSAKEEGVQIIVFPEDGIIGGGFLSREQLLLFLEMVPDVPSSKPINPCVDSSFQDRPILKKLSCLAREYEIVVVANMGDKQPCHTSPNRTCPPNGWYQFNTNVAFDGDGTLLAKYHKKHLFGPEKLLFDASNSTGCVSFTTSFGVKFGTFTCYDILYSDPADCLLRSDIQHFIFPTAWGSVYPYYMSIAVQQSWSWKHSVNLLAANQHYPHPIFDFYSTGSGLYSGGVAMDYYISGMEFQLATGQMIIADLPVDPRKLQPHSQIGNRSDIGNVGASGVAYPKFVLLQKSIGSVNVSYNSAKLGRELQCMVEYEIENSPDGDTYGIGAFIGSSTTDPTFSFAVCTLCKCASGSVDSCGQPVKNYETSTVFKEVRLSGDFSKGSEVLVTLLGSGLELIDLHQVSKRGEGDFVVKGLNEPLLAFSLWSGIFK